MAELLIVLVVLGVVVAVAWPMMRKASQAGDARDQPPVERGPVPPRHPDEPIPGSQTDRERKGRL
jgi:hypothetical protein